MLVFPRNRFWGPDLFDEGRELKINEAKYALITVSTKRSTSTNPSGWELRPSSV